MSKKLTTKDQAGLGHRRRHRPPRRLRRPERRLVAHRGRRRRRRQHPGGHPGPGVRPEERQGRQLPDVEPARLRAGWRGLRHREVRDDHRGQLDQGRRQERLPRPEVQDRRAARRAEGQGHPPVHPVLGHRRRLQGPGPGGRPRQGDEHRRAAAGLRRRLRRDAEPPVRRRPVQAKFPEDAPFIAGGEYGHGPINAPGMEQVVADLNSKLENFGGANLPDVLEGFDTNAGAALGK